MSKKNDKSETLHLVSGVAVRLCLAAVFFILPLTASAGEVSGLDSQGFVIIDGKPRLLLGLYRPSDNDSKLQEIADNGFNFVRVQSHIKKAADRKKILDRMDKYGLYGTIALLSSIELSASDQQKRQELTQIVETFKDHPALIGWELEDEVLYHLWARRKRWTLDGQQEALKKLIEENKVNASDKTKAKWTAMLQKAGNLMRRGLWKQGEDICDTLWAQLSENNPNPELKVSLAQQACIARVESLARGCELLRSIDSKNIIWENHAPRNSLKSMRLFNPLVDATGCDIYPAPFGNSVVQSDLTEVNLPAVGAYTDRMRVMAPNKSIWMVLQGLGWRDWFIDSPKASDPQWGRRPNLKESRFMAYDAIVHGANAILYWGISYIEEDSVLWYDLMKVAREIRALESAIVAENPGKEPVAVADESSASIDGQGPKLMLRKTGDDWVLIAVNESKQGISFQVNDLPGPLNGRVLYRLYSDESHKVQNDSFRDGIVGFGVHVYATSRKFEAK